MEVDEVLRLLEESAIDYEREEGDDTGFYTLPKVFERRTAREERIVAAGEGARPGLHQALESPRLAPFAISALRDLPPCEHSNDALFALARSRRANAISAAQALASLDPKRALLLALRRGPGGALGKAVYAALGKVGGLPVFEWLLELAPSPSRARPWQRWVQALLRWDRSRAKEHLLATYADGLDEQHIQYLGRRRIWLGPKPKKAKRSSRRPAETIERAEAPARFVGPRFDWRAQARELASQLSTGSGHAMAGYTVGPHQLLVSASLVDGELHFIHDLGGSAPRPSKEKALVLIEELRAYGESLLRLEPRLRTLSGKGGASYLLRVCSGPMDFTVAEWHPPGEVEFLIEL